LLAESSYAINENNGESKRIAEAAFLVLENFENSRMEIVALKAQLLKHAGRNDESRQLVSQLMLTEFRAPGFFPF